MSDTTPYPDDYVPRFTKPEVLRRILYLSGRCFLYKQKIKERHPWPLGIDPIALIDVTKSAMDDIWRYKIYHLRDRHKRSDSIKRAAYFTKWIVKLRPIYVARPEDDRDFEAAFDKEDYSLFANEGFAIFFSLQTLATEAKVPRITLSPKFMAHLLYDLHFRALNDDALLELYQLIRDTVKGEEFIVR